MIDFFRVKDCMKRFGKALKENATKITNYEKKKKKEMAPRTDEKNKSYKKQKLYYICKNDLVLMLIIKVS